MNIEFDKVPYRYKQGEDALVRGEKIFCPTCRKTLSQKMFFKSLDEKRHPSGYLPECRTCLTLMVDDSDPRTFLPILKEIDIPYIPSAWQTEMSKGAGKQTGTVLGKYASKMRLSQHKKYHWADTQTLVKRDAEQVKEVLKIQGKSETQAEEIVKSNTGYDMTSNSFVIDEEALEALKIEKQKEAEAELSPESAMAIGRVKELTPQTSKYGLTEQEIKKLKADWGSDYTEDEFLQLQQQYSDLTEAYIISDPIAVSNARLICKMTLKMNRFLDLDDIQSVSKLSRQLDLFIKSANLAPVQQKERQQTTFAISQLAALIQSACDFIPQYYQDDPQDKLDMILKDMKDYTNYLVKGESNLGEMAARLEDSLRKDNAAQKELQSYDEFSALENEVFSTIAEANSVPPDNQTVTIPKQQMVQQQNAILAETDRRLNNTLKHGNLQAVIKEAENVAPRKGRFIT